MLKKIFLILCVSTNLYSLESVLVLFGPPGAGKGTFSQFAGNSYDYAHLSVGDIIRDEIEKQSEIGKEAEACLQKGEFLDEALIQAVVLKHISPLATEKKRFILDGFPRTPEAVQFIKACFAQFNLNERVLLIMFKASDEVCLERILSRLTCKECGHVYNTVSSPPQQPFLCDLCLLPLKTRSNDTHTIVLKRLEEYHEITEKAYDFAKSLFPHTEFNTDLPLDECLQNYKRFLDES